MSRSFRQVVVLTLCLILLALPTVAGATAPAPTHVTLGAAAAAAAVTTSTTAQHFVGAGSWRETYPSSKMELYVDPAPYLGHGITVADIQSIVYHTYNDGTIPLVDFSAYIYTASGTSNCTGSWYCHRLTAEPYYSLGYAPVANAWATWNTAAGPNQLTWYDQANCGVLGFAGQSTTWADITGGAINWGAFPACSAAKTVDYRTDPVQVISFQTGSGWTAFDGFLDGITVTLTDGEVLNIDLEDQPASDVWVDDDWAGQAAGKEVAAGKFMGFNAFAKVQDGVNAVAAGNTVNVAAGAYAESIVLNKPVTVQGAGSGATDTVLSAPSGADSTTGIVQLTGSGTAAQPIKLKDLRLAPVGIAGITVGKFTQSTGTNVDYVTLDNVKVVGTNTNPCTEQERGLFVDSTSTLKHLTITNSAFDNLSYGWYFMKAVSADTSTVQYVTVSNTTFAHNNHKGIYAEKLSDATFTNVTVSDSGYDPSLSTACSYFIPNFAGFDINLKAGTYANIAFNNVVATNNAPTSANGANLTVKARGTGSDSSTYTPFPATLTNLTVTGGSFTGSKVGIRLGEPGKSNVGPTGVDIKQANLSGNAVYGVDNQTTTQVKAENNWWGTLCPAGAVNGNVDFDPWWLDAGGSATATAANLTIPAGATAAQQQALLNCAAPGSTVTFPDSSFPGGLVVNTNGLTINLGGATVGHGSPWLTVNADNLTVNGPGIIDGGMVSDPAILVQTGADNFILDGVEIKNWGDGVRLEGTHASLKLVNNWLHDNVAGFRFAGDTVLSGVVTIEGNLFKFNSGDGIANESAATIPALYNAWGNIGGPGAGDGAGANVTATPFTFVELFTDAAVTAKNVVDGDTFDVHVLANAAGMYGVQYQLTYDPTLLQVQTIADGVFGACTTNGSVVSLVPPLNAISSYCHLENAADVNGANQLVNTITFKVAPDGSHSSQASWTTYLDLLHDSGLDAGARNGIKAWVDNAGYGAPSTGMDITDSHDGTINIAGFGQYTGYVDLQGRTNDSGALLSVYNQTTIVGSTLKATATSVSSGAYTTANEVGQQLLGGNTYYLQFDRPLYLPTTILNPVGTSWADFKLLDTRPVTALGTVVLLGGDATNDDVVNVNDATCIGGAYGGPATACGVGGSSDVNGDGKVDILDLTLMGGNYTKTQSPWTE